MVKAVVLGLHTKFSEFLSMERFLGLWCATAVQYSSPPGENDCFWRWEVSASFTGYTECDTALAQTADKLFKLELQKFANVWFEIWSWNHNSIVDLYWLHQGKKTKGNGTFEIFWSVTEVLVEPGMRVKTRHGPWSGVSLPSVRNTLGLLVRVTLGWGGPGR